MLGLAGASVLPAGLAVLAGRQVGDEVLAVGLLNDLARTRVSPSITAIRTSGFATVGRGAALYIADADQRSSEAKAWRARDAGGRWWILAEPRLTYDMFGARAGPFRALRDRQAIQAANDFAEATGRAEVHGVAGAVYNTDREVWAGAGVANVLNGATIRATLTHPDDAALSVREFSSWKNGRLIVLSGVEPGSQACCHAGVRAGPVIGSSPSASDVDPQEGIKGWLLEDLIIETRAWSRETRAGKVAVQINGGTSGWIVRRVTAPDSALMAGLVHADWASVGPIVSADDRQRTNRTAYAAAPREGWTTHPHRGLIEDCSGGRFTAPVTGTDTGANGIRLSGCHDIVVRNCAMRATTYAALRIVGGDLGFEFALPVQRARAHKGLVIDAFRVEDARVGYACWVDLKADNVQRAVETNAYLPMLPTVPDTDIIIRALDGASTNGRSSGLRLNNLSGGQFIDCVLNGFNDGVQIDEGVRNVRLIRPVTRNNRRHGGVVDHARSRPAEVSVEQPAAERSGVAANGAHWLFGNCERCQLVGGTLGAASGETALWGIVLNRRGTQNIIVGSPRIVVREGGEAIARP
jgi:hypothetical protein